jgi:hypothetical protein
VEVVKSLDEILGASSPPRQLGNEDGVDLTRLGKIHNPLALGAVVLGP